MLERVVALGLVVQVPRSRGIWSLWVGDGHDVSSAPATGIHSINNCMALGKSCGISVVAARAVGVLSRVSRSNS